jgi:uncharacterized membrane protein
MGVQTKTAIGRNLRIALALGGAVLALAACGRGEKDEGSGVIPPADTPAHPSEPASAPVSAAPEDFSGSFDARGTDPSWTLKIRHDTVQLNRPDRKTVVAISAGVSRAGSSAMWEAQTAATGELVKVTINQAKCSDGLSDTAYPYRATVQVGGETLTGCAEPAG